LLDQFHIPALTADPRPDDPKAARSAFDRVRQVYEVRPDVREVFPLGLTPAQRGEYAAWLFRYGRPEYGLQDNDILCYLFALADDPACGLGDTYLLSPEWQRAVPHGLTVKGWNDLKRWVAARYPDRAGRWLRRARRPMKFDSLSNGEPAGAVNLLGHFKYESGLQEEALQHAAALQRAGYRTCLRDVPIAYPRDWRDGGRFTDPELGGNTLIKTGANEPLDEVYRRAGLHPRPGVYRVACWSWELEDWPRAAAARSGLADEVWTPSEFCAQAARAALPGKPVFPMPPAVVLPDFEPRPRAHFGLPADRHLFLFVFDMASGMERKNPVGLVRAFRRAFRPGDPVHLAVKVSRGHAYPEQFAVLRQAAAVAGVTLIDRVMPRAEVCALLGCCDSYVSLHRSEGFGFTMAEAMLLGKPTVATGYSGNLDFMTAENSVLVRHGRVPLDRDYPPYPAGGVWAAPCEEHAAELMRRVVEDRAGAAAVAARGRETVATLLSREAVAARMTTRLTEIQRP
jgi:glycosyltransferase involved in cell wall biosynthesis